MLGHELQAAPPTPVDSDQFGRSPMYSAISIGREQPHAGRRHTVDVVLRQSRVGEGARGRCWCNSNGVFVSTRPQSDSDAPTMATRLVFGTEGVSPICRPRRAAAEDLGVDDVTDLRGIPLARALGVVTSAERPGMYA